MKIHERQCHQVIVKPHEKRDSGPTQQPTNKRTDRRPSVKDQRNQKSPNQISKDQRDEIRFLIHQSGILINLRLHPSLKRHSVNKKTKQKQSGTSGNSRDDNTHVHKIVSLSCKYEDQNAEIPWI